MNTNLQKNPEMVHKRRIASKNECKIDLKEELPVLFEAFANAHKTFEYEIRQTPPQARARGFEASLLNSKMIQSIQEFFPENWKFGKYKRFTLRVNGYLVLFKKFNKKGMPMNIKTQRTDAISNQQVMSLFDDSTLVYEPILFFGYEKSRIGEILNPRLIYIDESQVKWIITDEAVSVTRFLNTKEEETTVLPKLKKTVAQKASGQ